MTPGERRELRTVVKQRMKVLRADVQQRQRELYAEAEQRLVERYRSQDAAVAEVNRRISEEVDRANAAIDVLLRQVSDQHDGLPLNLPHRLRAPRVTAIIEDRAQLHRAMAAGIEAQVRSALLDLDRQEAELLQALALGGLESDAARSFLGQIPTVGELVPSARLRQIEAAFDAQQGTPP